MTLEEIKKDVDQLQSMAKNIKEQAALLRTAVCGLQGAVNGSVEKKLAEAEQRGYEAGFAEGCKQAEDSCEGCANAEKPISALLCMTCRRRYPDKYQQAVEPDDEILVGDEVIAAFTDESGTAVVTRVNNKKEAWYVYADGSVGYDDFSKLEKTGRHFDEVEKLLEAMRK